MGMRAGLWALLFLAGLTWSGVAPHDRLTWVLEVFPAVLAAIVLLITRRRFPLTPLLYFLILLHCWVLMIGGKYTYAEVPLFNWIKTTFGLARNEYDHVGHFFQGFVPALVAREVLIRRAVVRGTGWLFFVITAICLAISAGYELLEWAAGVALGGSAEAFLGTQGDQWDTQKDIFFALIGAVVGQLALGRLHDRQLELI